MESLSQKEVKMMRHAVGVDDCRSKKHWGRRNRYAVAIGNTEDLKIWNGLVDRGFAETISVGTDVAMFVLTKQGCKAIGLGPAATKRALED